MDLRQYGIMVKFVGCGEFPYSFPWHEAIKSHQKVFSPDQWLYEWSLQQRVVYHRAWQGHWAWTVGLDQVKGLDLRPRSLPWTRIRHQGLVFCSDQLYQRHLLCKIFSKNCAQISERGVPMILTSWASKACSCSSHLLDGACWSGQWPYRPNFGDFHRCNDQGSQWGWRSLLSSLSRGSYARKSLLITHDRHLVLESAHPSPLIGLQ